MDDELDLLDIVRILRKNLWVITALVILITSAVSIFSLLSPKIYRATASLLPPQEQQEMGVMGMEFSRISQLTGGLLPAPTTPADLFVAMLKSRTMADAVVDQFDLMRVYEAEYRDQARRRLEDSTRLSVSKEKVISISVEDTQPQRAADMANFYVDQLDILSRTINLSAAKRNRLFIEGRLEDTKAQLATLEEALQTYQTEHKTVSLEQQAKSAIEAAAELQAHLTASEVELQVLESYLSPNNPDVIKKRLAIREMQRHLNRMQYGPMAIENDGVPFMTDGDALNPAFVKMPFLGLNLARLTREVKVQETLYTLLTSQYEQAKIQEARNTPTVQVLDRAIAPERKIKPSIRTNTLLAFVISAFIAVFAAFLREGIRNMVERSKRGNPA